MRGFSIPLSLLLVGVFAGSATSAQREPMEELLEAAAQGPAIAPLPGRRSPVNTGPAPRVRPPRRLPVDPKLGVFEVRIEQVGEESRVGIVDPRHELVVGDHVAVLDTLGLIGNVIVEGSPTNDVWPTRSYSGPDLQAVGTQAPGLRPARGEAMWGLRHRGMYLWGARTLVVSADGQAHARAIRGIDPNRLLAAIDRDGDGSADVVLLGWAGRTTSLARHRVCSDYHSTVRVWMQGVWRTVRHSVTNQCQFLGDGPR